MGGVATTNAIFKPIYYSRSLQLDMSANAPFPEVGALCKIVCTLLLGIVKTLTWLHCVEARQYH